MYFYKNNIYTYSKMKFKGNKTKRIFGINESKLISQSLLNNFTFINALFNAFSF